jgi:inner membrane protein
MNTQNTIKKTGDFLRTSATFKIFSIGILVLILLIPISLIGSLMREREHRRDMVVREINAKWGNAQTITGPFFTVPYKSYFKDKDDKEKSVIKYFHILPKSLKISGKIIPHVRYRSIYEAVLYNTTLTLTGTFATPQLSQFAIEPENVLWDKALFSIGISDMRGIREDIHIMFGEKKYSVSPGLKTTDIAGAGISAIIPLPKTEQPVPFSFNLNINGSEQIQFVPVAEQTDVKMVSDWPSPSFNGAFLPTERKITDQGFSATWRVLHLNRNFPQSWEGNRYTVTPASFGVRLLITADIYQKSIRISKYALMFIIFTFAAFFFSEIISRKRVHPIQYLLIGLAISLFYILLLAISEQFSFNSAYLLSASVITVMITAYSRGIIKNRKFTLTLFGIQLILYAYLYIVLQLEDYALLMGSIGLLIVLGTIMFITRKIDWYDLDMGDKE